MSSTIGYKDDARISWVRLLGGLHVAASLGIFGLTFLLSIGAGMTCRNDCEPYGLWIVGTAANVVGQFVAFLAMLAVLRRMPLGRRKWATSSYAVISLTPTVLLVVWIELYRLVS